MKYVTINRTTESGPEEIGRVVLDDGVITFQGDFTKNMVEDMREGVRDPESGTNFTPKSGIRFLKVLKFKFSGSMIRATDVIEVKTVTA